MKSLLQKQTDWNNVPRNVLEEYVLQVHIFKSPWKEESASHPTLPFLVKGKCPKYQLWKSIVSLSKLRDTLSENWNSLMKILNF